VFTPIRVISVLFEPVFLFWRKRVGIRDFSPSTFLVSSHLIRTQNWFMNKTLNKNKWWFAFWLNDLHYFQPPPNAERDRDMINLLQVPVCFYFCTTIHLYNLCTRHFTFTVYGADDIKCSTARICNWHWKQIYQLNEIVQFPDKIMEDTQRSWS